MNTDKEGYNSKPLIILSKESAIEFINQIKAIKADPTREKREIKLNNTDKYKKVEHHFEEALKILDNDFSEIKTKLVSLRKDINATYYFYLFDKNIECEISNNNIIK